MGDCVRFNVPQIQDLARQSGVQDVSELLQNSVTKPNLTQLIQDVGGRTDDDDFVVIYFLGHGTSWTDKDGDEADHEDEALCLVSDDGCSFDYMIDDEWAELLTSSFDPQTRLLLISDCCQSGTMADMDKANWRGRQAINMTACADDQSGFDFGSGSFFTNCLVAAVKGLHDKGKEHFSVAEVYNATLKVFDKECRDKLAAIELEQSLGIECPPGYSMSQMQW